MEHLRQRVSDEPPPQRIRNVVRIAGYMPSSQLKHGEVLVVMMEVGLFEQIPPSWQEEGNLHQKLQKVREPRVLRPKWSHQGELQPPKLPDLRQYSRDEAEGRKGISLKTVPTLEHGIRAR